MAAEGSTCVIADIASGEAIVSEIRAAGGQAEEIPTDVSDETQVKDLARQVLERHGGADILVNNAALYSTLPPVQWRSRYSGQQRSPVFDTASGPMP